MDDDRERFTVLFERHYPDVLRYASRRIDPDQARDVAAETFLVAWRRFEEVPSEADEVLPWLYSVARNTLANQQRGDRRRTRLGARLKAAPQRMTGADHAGPVVESLWLREAMATLSAKDREALQLVGWEELDVTSAATVVGCSPSTFAVRLHRARRRLDRALAERGGQEAGAHRQPAMKEARS
ncbi:sigma-70 family RNA polymerase sigma factor [Actinomadura spongiicola]|uniref:Sigma-70 family RNA polymerase sigma factor n=1 Tax=Actinomadura spongiicola TaxID=2303421 RepID=A0A372GPK3_9ACTN|nr:sigma-70 family RNA polymerase sigma factor [Actinomadura spongiicola]RFS87039.1 sigma-70 family RNA polymerase sigma factor [Actinomadura spongiicola]